MVPGPEFRNIGFKCKKGKGVEMSLREYEVESDCFDYFEASETRLCDFKFPCIACKFHVLDEQTEPCRSCGHVKSEEGI